MNRVRRTIHFTAAAIFGLVAGGCSALKPQEDPTRFFILREVIPSRSLGVEKTLSVGIGRVRIPDYLQSSKIVVRKGEHELTYSDIHRWGEDLDGAIGRSLEGQMGEFLPEGEIMWFPWRERREPDHLVSVEILRFEGDQWRNHAWVKAKWKIAANSEEVPAKYGRTEFRESWNGKDFGALVGSLNEGVVVMAREISAALSEMRSRE